MTREALLNAGFTLRDLRRFARLAEIPDSAMDELKQEVHRRTDQAQDTAVTAIWRKYRELKKPGERDDLPPILDCRENGLGQEEGGP
jgi:hypothetical protein